MQEKIVEIKACKHCSAEFHITDKDMEFYEKVSPVFSCRDTICRDTINRVSTRKYLIPPPLLCPDCRQQRRLSFKNIHNLYKNGSLISAYSPDKGYNVVSQEEWFSGSIDGLKYGRDFDFSRGFFEQFHELQKVAPRWNLIQFMSENCDRTLNVASCKDSYMIKSSAWCENCFYSERLIRSAYIFDGFVVNDSDNCYELIDSERCHNVFWGQKLVNCKDSYFLYDCQNLEKCICSVGLKNKKYHILNEEVTKEEYENVLYKLFYDNSFKQDLINKFNFLKSKNINKNLQIINCENVVGDEIYNSKNIFYSFGVKDSEDCKYVDLGTTTKTSYDVSGPDEQELTYETCSNYKLYKSLFIFNSLEVDNSFYCETCFGIKNCFGCVGLRNKSYCILNKQYTKEEYETLVPKIIEYMMKTGEWGEFFPSSMSPFGYNETVAMEYFPLDRKDTINRVSTDGNQIFNWSTYEAPFPKVDKIIPASKLPDDIKDIPDDILNRAIMPDDECDENDVGTGFKPVPTEKQIKKPFRITPQELEFYRKHNLPIPRKHPDQRHLDRMKLRNPRKLFDRKCDKCGSVMKTTYAPDRKEIVYCEDCYEKEVY